MANAFLVRPLALAGATASTSAAGTVPTNLGNDYIGVVHKAGAVGGHSIVVDLGSAMPVDFVSFLSAAPASFSLRTRAFASVASANAGTSALYDSGVLAAPAGAVVPTSGRVNTWLEPTTAQTRQAWRFDVSGEASVFSAGRLVLGQKLQFGRNFSFGMAPGVIDTGSVDWTESGAMMRRFGRIMRTLDIDFACLTRVEAEETLLPLLEVVGNTSPLLLVTDPAAHAQRQRRMYFGFLQSDLKVPIKAYDVWTWKASFRSVI